MIKIPYEPREWQLEAANRLRRFSVFVCHRRAGKTVFNVIQNIGKVLSCTNNRPQGAYIAPTYGMAKRIAWDYYKEFLEPLRRKNLVTFNETSLRIDFVSGAKIFLLGAEDPDAIRGMYMDHVVLDEYQKMPADFFEKVIRPLLSDRQGEAIFTGTPSGRNHFYDLYQKGLIEDEESWSSLLLTYRDTNAIQPSEIKAARSDMSEEAFLQEYECSFDAAVKGAYFGKNIARLKVDDRLRADVSWDPNYPVVTGWDIGLDGTVIWYVQKIGDQLRLIDCDMFEDKDIPYCVNKVLNKPYTYQLQILPSMDGNRRSVLDKKNTPKKQIESLGLKCKQAPGIKREPGIHITRNFLDRVVISTKCDKKQRVGRVKISPLDSLSLYRAEWDETKGVSQTSPVHDRHSHTADALRTLATGLKDNTMDYAQVQARTRRPKEVINNSWNPLRRR